MPTPPHDTRVNDSNVTEGRTRRKFTQMVSLFVGLPGTAALASDGLGQQNIGEQAISYVPLGSWLSDTAYKISDMVLVSGIVFVCQIAHTSGTFKADLAANKWKPFQGLTRDELFANNGSSLIGHTAQEPYAVATNLQALGNLRFDAVAHFGCDTSGKTNSTIALKAFFDACISTRKSGHIPAGRYLINEGTLVFDTPFADAAWPDITTAGHDAVYFQATGFLDAPLLTFSNGTATSEAGKYWRGGSLGGITFLGAGTGSVTHGLSLRGLWGTKFGWMRGNNLKGDLINVPRALYGGRNPDPYATSFIEFDAIEANSCTGFACRNQNFVGQDRWRVKRVRAVGCVAGVWFGMGSGTVIDEFSVGGCSGWTFDDGTNLEAIGGPPQRFSIGIAEFDNVEYGIRLNKSSLFDIRKTRFIHRFHIAPNVSKNYWPRTAIDLAGGAAANVRMGSIEAFHRIERGGVLADLGVFLQGNSNGNIIDVNVSVDYADNANLGMVDSKLFENIANIAALRLNRLGRSLFDTSDKPIACARGSASTVVPSTGFGTGKATISFPTEVFSQYSRPYNCDTSLFTAPRRGLYRVKAALPLTLPVGTRVRMGLLTAAGAECVVFAYQVNRGLQTYQIEGQVLLLAGQTVGLCADQNTDRPVNCTPSFNANEVRFSVEAM